MPLWLKCCLKLILAVAGLAALNAPAQEAVRMSQVNHASSEARQLSHATIGYYNLDFGKLTMRFGSSMTTEFNDNINRVENGKESSLILSPGFNTDIRYPVSEHNTLNLSVGMGYSYYVSHSDRSSFSVSPNSELSFDVFVGDVKINLHDRVSVQPNSYLSSTANGNAQSSELNNTVGISAMKDLNKLQVTLGYDHNNTVWFGNTQQSQSSQPDGSMDTFFGNFGVRCPYNIMAGVEAGGGFINYDQSNNSTNLNNTARNATEANLGLFAQAQVSEYLSAQVNGGYQVYMPESMPADPNPSSNGGLYFGLSVTHRVNQWVSYVVSGGRSQNLSTYGSSYESYYARLTPGWKIFKKTSVGTPIFWEHGNSSYSNFGGSNASTFDQYGAGLSLGRPITQKLSSSLTYTFVKETSDGSGLSYIVNTVSLNFTYQF